MKKYISHLVFALLGCAALSACVDDDYMELDKGQNETDGQQDGSCFE